MDDTGLLHTSLRTKLNLLEAKLEAHRLALQGEFCQYYHDLTRHAASTAVASINNQLQASTSQYRVLGPRFPPDPAASSRALLHSTSKVTTADSPGLPPVTVTHQSEPPSRFQTLSLASTVTPPNSDSSNHLNQVQAPDNPRDRDRELHGLFMPSYLALLQTSHNSNSLSDNSPVSPSATPVSASLPALTNNPLVAETGRLLCAESGMMHSNTTQFDMKPAPAELSRSTTPSRHQPTDMETADVATADDLNSSPTTDKCENKAPRSALRCSSSSYRSPLSPRRVRFDFMGDQVLPTASPQPANNMSYSPDHGEGEDVSVDSILGADPSDDLELPPRKVSSSDALRALSREPLEDGTVWTVVNPEVEDTVRQETEEPDSEEPQPTSEVQIQQVEHDIRHGAHNDAEYEEEASIRVKTCAGQANMIKSGITAVRNSARNRNPDNPFDDLADDDDMFQFEEDSGRPWTPKPLRANVEDDMESEDGGEAYNATTEAGLAMLTSPTSVAPASVPVAKPERPEPTTPTNPRFYVGSVGSYKGRSIFMPIVKSPEIHAKAASIGNFTSFVGGLDGTSGMDAADPSSYRASFVRDGFSGTPRSFTERLFMEEMEAERLDNKKKDF